MDKEKIKADKIKAAKKLNADKIKTIKDKKDVLK